MSDDKKERARQRRLATARDLEARGHIDHAVTEFLKAKVPAEAARLLAKQGRLRDAGQAILDGLGMKRPADVGGLSKGDRELVRQASLFFEHGHEEARAEELKDALVAAPPPEPGVEDVAKSAALVSSRPPPAAVPPEPSPPAPPPPPRARAKPIEDPPDPGGADSGPVPPVAAIRALPSGGSFRPPSVTTSGSFRPPSSAGSFRAPSMPGATSTDSIRPPVRPSVSPILSPSSSAPPDSPSSAPAAPTPRPHRSSPHPAAAAAAPTPRPHQSSPRPAAPTPRPDPTGSFPSAGPAVPPKPEPDSPAPTAPTATRPATAPPRRPTSPSPSPASPSRSTRPQASSDPALSASGEVITDYAGGRAQGWRDAGNEALENSIAEHLVAGRKGAAARIARDAGQYDRALAWFVELDLYHQAGACLRSIGRYDDALAMLLRQDIKGPNYRRACFELVGVAIELGKLDFVIDRFLSAFIEAGPADRDEIETYLGLAKLYLASDFTSGAKRCLRKILASDPAHIEAKLLDDELRRSARASSSEAPRAVLPASARGLPPLPGLDEFTALARAHIPSE